MNTPSDIKPLLTRLGLKQPPAQSLDALRDAVARFRRTIPFENLDPLAEIPVSVSIEDILAKVVAGQRGGYCFELNQLMGALLEHAGIEFRYAMARVAFGRPRPSPLTHLVLIVSLSGEEWLVDVGFGGPGPSEPLPFANGTAWVAGDGSEYRIEHTPEMCVNLYRRFGQEWTLVYSIAPIEVQQVDLVMASHFVSTWQPSPFRNRFMCIAHDGEANWTIDKRDLTQRDAHWQPIATTTIRDTSHLLEIFAQIYRIEPSSDLVARAWQRAAPSFDPD